MERLLARRSDARQLRADVIAHLRTTMDIPWFVWLLTDPRTAVGVDPMATVPDLSDLPDLIRTKYTRAVNRWTTLNDVATAAPWSEGQRRHGVVEVASAVFRDRSGLWGFLDLWSPRPFTAADLDQLGRLLPSLTQALRVRQSRTFEAVPGTPPVTGPAVLVLDADLSIVGHTAASDSWLRLLLPPPQGSSPVPAAALNVAAQLLAVEAGVDEHEPSGRVHVGDGQWLTLRASRITPGEQIAVTIEASSPEERLDVFGRSFELSSREQELVGALLRGADTTEIAARMFVSAHTVQDHLKSVFAKTGLRSRRDILARLR